MTKLSYEEWRLKYHTTIADGVIESLKMFHNVDAEKEVEFLMKQEYQNYLSAMIEKFSEEVACYADVTVVEYQP